MQTVMEQQDGMRRVGLTVVATKIDGVCSGLGPDGKVTDSLPSTTA